MISLDDYLMGRDKTHAGELTETLLENASILLGRCNGLLVLFYGDIPKAPRRKLTSGWRPQAINDALPVPSPHSTHLTGEGIDLDDADRKLAHWCLLHSSAMKRYSIWMERPEATPTHVHWQSRAPYSGERFFWPSKAAHDAFIASEKPPMS